LLNLFFTKIFKKWIKKEAANEIYEDENGDDFEKVSQFEFASTADIESASSANSTTFNLIESLEVKVSITTKAATGSAIMMPTKQEEMTPKIESTFSTRAHKSTKSKQTNKITDKTLFSTVHNPLKPVSFEQTTLEYVRTQNDVVNVLSPLTTASSSIESSWLSSNKPSSAESRKTTRKRPCKFKDYDHLKASIGEYVYIPCSARISKSKLANGHVRVNGTRLFRCESNGEFVYVNSTCFIEKSKWLENYLKQVKLNLFDYLIIRRWLIYKFNLKNK
jgi:hypothetical protein